MANSDLSYRVHGDAIVQAGVGSSNALVNTCYSEQGVQITFRQMSRAIMTDLGGSEVPAEFQYMGEMAIIDILAPAWVETYARLLRTRHYQADMTTRAADGVSGARGQLWGTHGLAFALAVIAGDFGEDPWYFPTCMVPPDAMGLNLGTEYAKHRFRFVAWPFISGASLTGVGKTLYARTIP